VINDIEGVWRFFLALNAGAPLWLWTALVGLLMSLGVTQFLKHGLAKVTPVETYLNPERAQRRKDRREFAIELIAGAVSTWLLHRGVPGLLLGILAGLLAPYVWSGLAVLVRPVAAWWARRWSAK
jgi:hypothetical protein